MIRPFSGPRYYENSTRCGELHPCVLCGKPIEKPEVWAEVINGGCAFGPMNTTIDTNDPGYMGCFPVGPECRKKLEAEGIALAFH